MRFTLASIFGLMALSAGAMALPVPGAKPSVTTALSLPVRMVCDPHRCFDPRSGVYSSSACDGRGCYQSGPIIGYLSPRQLRDLSKQHGYRGYRHDERYDRRPERHWRY